MIDIDEMLEKFKAYTKKNKEERESKESKREKLKSYGFDKLKASMMKESELDTELLRQERDEWKKKTKKMLED